MERSDLAVAGGRVDNAGGLRELDPEAAEAFVTGGPTGSLMLDCAALASAQLADVPLDAERLAQIMELVHRKPQLLLWHMAVLAVQNADPHEIGTATSSNNVFREIGAAVGVAVFSTLFTGHLADNLVDVAASVPPEQAALLDPTGVTPAAVHTFPEPRKQGVIDGFASALAPAFWYLVPILAIGFLFTLFLREVTLSNEAGMVARGEAVTVEGAAARGRRGDDRHGRDGPS